MGHIIERIAIERGHEVVSTIDINNMDDFDTDAFRSADVAIEFTTPSTAVGNIHKAWAQGVPVVCGTTGWQSELSTLKEELISNGKGLFWTSNFSLGVNILFAMNKRLAEIMSSFPGYKPSITEIHHIHKLDAPSGTAVTMREGVEPWYKDVEIESIREGEVPGTHTITYDSSVDTISLTHAAKSREGFALGAVMAAEFMMGKKGFYDMHDMLKF